MTDRELMQQALDALEYAADEIGCPNNDDSIGIARKALRARLAQPEQEWQGLTDEERLALWSNIECDLECLKPAQYARAIEAKLREKNNA